MNANVFLIITKAAKDVIRPLMSDYEYDGPNLKAVKLFRRMAHFTITENKWKSPTIAGKKRYLYSITIPANQKAKDAIDYLLAEYPNQIAVGGAWWWDGRQVGTQWALDEGGSRTGDVTGTPTHPIPSQLIQFMPDIIERDSEGAIISTTPAMVLTDVNKEQGCAPRRFN